MENNRVITIPITGDGLILKKTVYLVSDVHWDSPGCDTKLLKNHLDDALQEDAIILIGGDFFDIMQTKKDKRASYNQLLTKYKTDGYLDAVIEDAAHFLEPYAKNIWLFSYGNHENYIISTCNTDPVQRTVKILQSLGSPVQAGDWVGWVRLLFRIGTWGTSVKIYYSHSGGVNSSSAAMSSIKRQATFEPDADVVWNGHTHSGYIIPITRERLSTKGKIYTQTAWFVRSPGYKQDWNLKNSYSVRKDLGPSTLGCVVLNILYDKVKGINIEAGLKVL